MYTYKYKYDNLTSKASQFLYIAERINKQRKNTKHFSNFTLSILLLSTQCST